MVVRRILLGIVSFLLPAAFFSAVYSILQAQGPLLPGLVLCGCTGVAVQLRVHADRAGSATALRLRRYIGIILPAATALYILFFTLIIPIGVWIVWLDMVAAGNSRGSSSYVFAMIGGFSIAVAAGCLGKKPIQAIFGGSAAAAVLVAMVRAPLETDALSWVPAAAAAIFLLLSAAALTARFVTESRSRTRQAAKVITPLLLITIATALALTAAGKPSGSKLVNRYISPALRSLTIEFFPRIPVLFNISSVGHQFSSQRLGETPQLSRTLVFSLSAPPRQTLYLRTDIFDQYTDSSWASLEDEPEIIESGMRTNDWVLLREDYPPPYPPEQVVNLEVRTDFFPSIPHVLGSPAVRPPSGNVYGDTDTGMYMDLPLMYGDTIAIALAGATPQPDVPVLSEAEERRYTQLPNGLDQRIIDIAESFARPAEQDADYPDSRIADRILGYFRQQDFRYSLHPPQRGSSEELVEFFLFTAKSGYCVHFATAFTVLARAAGIPARYVTGFYVPRFSVREGQPYTATEITGYSAHAWSEIYLPESGWVRIEATPPMQTELDRNTISLAEDRETSRQMEMLFGLRSEQDSDNRTFPLLLITLLLAAAAAAGLAIRILAVRIVPLLGSESNRFSFELQRLVRAGNKHGLPDPQKCGWREWCNRARERGALRYPGTCFRIVTSCSFGSQPVLRRHTVYIRLTRKSLISSQ